MMNGCLQCLQICDYVFRNVEDARNKAAALKADEEYLRNNSNKFRLIMDGVREKEKNQEADVTEIDWLNRAGSLRSEVVNIRDELGRVPMDDINCSLCCLIYCRNLGRRTNGIRRRLEELLGETCAQEIERSISNIFPRPKPVIRLLDQSVFPINGSYAEFWRQFDNEMVQVIGIHGMIGIGKSIFLKRINDDFLADLRGFEVVIFVSQSSISDIKEEVRRIQDEIANRLGTTLPSDCEIRRQRLRMILSRMKALLLLDHLLDGVTLSSLGVPAPDRATATAPAEPLFPLPPADTTHAPVNQPKICKVVFTARRHSTGIGATVHEVELGLLSEPDARELFKNEVWQHNPNSEAIKNKQCRDDTRFTIEDLAHEIADMCGGLPKALVKIGTGLRSKLEPEEWRNELWRLGQPEQAFDADPEGQVYADLKEAYDSLTDRQSEDAASEKKCFLFCSLFPEDHPIEENELKRHWMLEEYLGKVRKDRALDVYFDRAVSIVQTLKRAHLLTSSGSDHQSYVKMHRQFHYMARWVAQRESREKNFVRSGGRLDNLTECHEEVKRIFLMSRGGELNKINCPSLSTLVIRNCKVRKIERDLLDSIEESLKVLDLGRSALPVFELNDAKMIGLQYLNLSHTNIKEFPFDLKKLLKLKFLDLSFTKRLIVTSLKGLSALTDLQLLNLYYCGPCEFSGQSPVSGSLLLLEDMEKLNHLGDLALTIDGHPAFQKLETFSKKDVTHSMVITNCQGTPLKLELIATAKKLEVLHIIDCSAKLSWSQQAVNPEQCFTNLRDVELKGCWELEDLTWLKYAQALQSLKIIECVGLAQVIKPQPPGSANSDPLPFVKLSNLELRDLHKLKSICSQDLCFTSLKSIIVRNCAKLETIPIADNRDRRTEPVIECQRVWWSKIRDQARKSRLRPEFPQWN